MELTENVVTELRKLQAQIAELLLGLGAQGVAAGGPEVGDGGADGGVVLAGVLVDVAGVRDLALGRRVDAVDLAAGQAAQLLHPELLGQGVHARVLQQLLARLVDRRDRRVLLQHALARQLFREVVAGVQKFEEAAHSVELFGYKIDLSRLGIARVRKSQSPSNVNSSKGWVLGDLHFHRQ